MTYFWVIFAKYRAMHDVSFVCLCAGYLKKLWTDSDEILWTSLECDKDELIRFWWRSESGSGSDNFKSDSSPLRDRAKNYIYHDIS